MTTDDERRQQPSGAPPADFTGSPLMIVHPDGITGRWDVGAYPGLAAQHRSLIAGVLLRDHRRVRDDGPVVAMRPAS